MSQAKLLSLRAVLDKHFSTFHGVSPPKAQSRKTERETSRNKDEPIQPCFAVFFSWEQAKLPFAAPERFLVLAPLRLPPHLYSPAYVTFSTPMPWHINP